MFSGIGEIAGLFGDTIGLVGGLVSELTGSKFSKLLKEHADKSSTKSIKKLKKNLDKMTFNKKLNLKNCMGNLWDTCENHNRRHAQIPDLRK